MFLKAGSPCFVADETSRLHRTLLKPSFFQGYTALLIACYSGTSDLAAFLVDNGASLHAVTSRRMSALHLAAEGGDVDLVRMLLLVGVGICFGSCDWLSLESWRSRGTTT